MSKRTVLALAGLALACGLLTGVPAQDRADPGDLPAWMAPVIRVSRSDKAAYNAFMARHRVPQPAPGQFPKKMAQVALPDEHLPKVIPGHPRLLVRGEPWPGGLSLEQLRLRAGQAPWAAGLKQYRDPKYGARCALYYLATGDESVAPAIIEWILSHKHAGYGLGGGPFLAYDWIYHSKALTPEKRKEVVEHLVKLAYGAVDLQEGANCGDVWRHRGGGAVDPLLAGLVLFGEHPEGKKLLAMGMGYYRRAFLQSWQHTDGGWLSGGHSYDGASWHLPLALACWASATEEDIFQVIRRDYGDWLQNRLCFWMHQVLPDRTRSESIGTDYCPWKLIINTDEFLLVSRAFQNPDGYHFLRWLGSQYEPKSPAGLHILFYDERLEGREPSAVFSRPFSKVWGRSGLGYVQMRSKGWAPDSAVIEFKAGDYFELHGHYANQNSFYIYHRGRLALQGGIYDSFGRTDHWDFYYRRTLAANSMLVFQPGEFRTGSGPIALKNGGFVQDPGGQRADGFGYRNFTQDEYLWRLKNDPRYEMGDITAFEHADDFSYTYVCGDATAAYNNPKYCFHVETADGVVANRPKIDLFTRSLVYLPPDRLVVFDRVNSLDPAWRKAWVLHCLDRPQINGRMVRAEVPDHIEDFDGDTTTVTWAGGFYKPPDQLDPGRLIIRTFLPGERCIRRIGGEGFEYWANGQNHVPRYPPNLGRTDGNGQDVGNWRIEVSPARPANFDNFLNLVHITDARTRQAPPAEMLAEADEKMVGLAVGPAEASWVVMFGKRGRVDGPVSYRSPGKAEHLVVDLKPSAAYRVSGQAGGDRTLTASREGTLRFSTERAGDVRLVPAE